ncbi:SapC family protein [Brevundimonas sp.]|uniref:SapC family protein n=1 Tax=Brevundimonas sp. TaxID=1871086 RepID=UPI00356B1DC2
MTDTTTNASPLSGNVLFYGKPEPLSVEAHSGLGVDPVAKPYGFVAQSNIVPVMVTEFAPAALSYPVIFVGDNRQPVAVMGLRQGENLFVTDDGEFRAEAYIPAYIRRYPFVFANDDVQKRMILCVDRSASFIREGGETPLFVDGQPSPYTQQAMEFCNNFEQERQRTDAFVKLLGDLELLETREALFTPRNADGSSGQPQKIAEYFAVSEDKLKALSAKKLVELRDNGALGQIYAHLTSLLGWDRLIAIAFQRAAAEQPVAGNA